MTERGKQPGNIGELLTMGMCVLALTVVMLNYLQNVQLLQAKENVGQLARAYLLKMETVFVHQTVLKFDAHIHFLHLLPDIL